MGIIHGKEPGSEETRWTGSNDCNKISPECFLHQLIFSSKRRLSPSVDLFLLACMLHVRGEWSFPPEQGHPNFSLRRINSQEKLKNSSAQILSGFAPGNSTFLIGLFVLYSAYIHSGGKLWMNPSGTCRNQKTNPN